MSESMGKIKNIGVGFIQIGAAKINRHACFLETSKNVRRLHTLKIFDRMPMTFDCTDLNKTNANTFLF
jgi:hypothetical protein